MSLRPPLLPFLLLACVSGAQADSSGAGSAIPNAMSTTLDLGEEQIELHYVLSLLPGTKGNENSRLRVELDLGQLYAPLTQWIDAQLPHDRCARPGRDNWSAGPAELELALRGEELLLQADLPVQLWWCERLLGRNLKANLDGHASLGLFLRLHTASDHLQLQVADLAVRADGDLGELAEGWLRLRGTRLTELLQERLQRGQQALQDWWLPSAISLLDGRLQSARFIERDGIPAAEVVLSLRLDGRHWLELLGLLRAAR